MIFKTRLTCLNIFNHSSAINFQATAFLKHQNQNLMVIYECRLPVARQRLISEKA